MYNVLSCKIMKIAISCKNMLSENEYVIKNFTFMVFYGARIIALEI
jgi:hypothetical protein